MPNIRNPRKNPPVSAGYSSNQLFFPEVDSEQPGQATEQGFHSNVSLKDGHAGCKKIDTTFENFSDTQVNRPRSTLPSPAIRGMSPDHSGVRPVSDEFGRDRYPHRET